MKKKGEGSIGSDIAIIKETPLHEAHCKKTSCTDGDSSNTRFTTIIWDFYPWIIVSHRSAIYRCGSCILSQ